jgi:hypothetical protein
VVVVPFGPEPFARVTLSLPGGAATGGESIRANAAVASLLKALPPICSRLALSVYTDQAQIEMEVQSSGVRYALEALSCLRLDLAGSIEEGEMTPLLTRGEQAWNRLRDAGQFSSNDWKAGWTGQYLRRTLSPEEAVLLVVGKVDVEATLAIIRERFATWKVPPGTPLAFSTERRAPERVAVVLDNPGTRTAVAIVLIPTDRGGAPGEVVAVADELAANRLERLALVNGIKGRAVNFVKSPGLSALRFRLEGKVDRVAKVLGLALEQVGAAATSPPSEAELALARWNVVRGWLYTDLGLNSMSYQASELERSGDDPKAWDARGRRLAAVEAEPAHALFRSGQNGHEAIWISGDQKGIVPALVKLGFAPEVLPALKKD